MVPAYSASAVRSGRHRPHRITAAVRFGLKSLAAARIRDTALSLSSLVIVGVGWQIWSSNSRILPTLNEVIASAPGFYAQPQVFIDILATFQRVVVSVAIALILGLAGALISRRGGLLGQVIDTYVSFTIAIPSTVAALLALFVFHRSEAGVYVVVSLVIWPFMVMTLRGGLELMDGKLDGMAEVYHFGTVRRLRKVVIPQIVPFAFAAVRSENAHAWRVVVLAEVFAVNSGMGAEFTKAYDRFLLDEVVLWIFTFVVILLFVEYVLLRPLENRIMRWRFHHGR